MKAMKIEKLNKGLIALLLFGMSYLGLMLFLNTSSPFLVVQGTSMEPTLHAGDLLLSKSIAPTDIKVGDVITFDVPSDAQQRLRMPPKATHRVIGIEGQDGQMVFVTQGDNSDVDPFKVLSSMVHGVVAKNMGPLGWPILLITNKTILLFLGIPILTFVLIVMAMLWMSPSEKSQAPAPKRTSARAAKAADDMLPAQIGIPLDRLTSAVSSYGVHLQSHTSIIKHMAGSSEGLEDAVKQQNSILAELASVVREMKYHQVQSVPPSDGQGSANGQSKTNNGARIKKVSASGKGNGKSKSSSDTARLPRHPAKANGNNGSAKLVPHPANGPSRDQRVKALVAEIEARIKASPK